MIGKYYPLFTSIGWVAGYKYVSKITGKKTEKMFRDFLGDVLIFDSEETAIEWCSAKNIIDEQL
jgi:hypothetical protein